MGYGVFSDCVKLKNVTLPSNMTKLASQTFYGCLGLESITLPDAVTSIGDVANLMGKQALDTKRNDDLPW
jgi:hypothetical protein